ncbi:MAG: hypothetical protein KDH90_12460 [Anaerolineae bacterium]|nr:hypothetical protein [Anaerolineae bacterium]
MTSLLDKHAGDPTRFASLSLKEFLAGLSSEDGTTFIFESDTDDEPEPEQPATPTPYVLILDQFEEIVTAHPGRWQERTAFFTQLNQALLDDPNLWVLMTLREDYVAALDPYKPLMFNRLHATFFMERMGEAAALDAVRRPAELGGRPFAAGVAEKLVDDLLQVRVPGQETTIKGQYVEPVQLQVVCYQLWQTLTANAPLWQASDMGKKPVEITFEDLAMAGDVNQALEKFYDDTLQDTLRELQEASIAGDVGERQLRSWFEDELITEAGTRGLMRQGDETTGTLPNAVVRKLQLHFLVRSETRSGDTWFELIHDRFVEPVRSSNLEWKQQRRLEQPWIDAAYSWHESGDSPETRNAGLLLADLNLKTVLADTAGQQFEPVVMDYLDASKTAQAARDQEAALNAERIKAEEANRTAGQLRRQRVALAVLAGVTGLLFLIAVGQALMLDKANAELSTANADLRTERDKVLQQNDALVISGDRLKDERNRANTNERAAIAARDENRSLTLADRSVNAAQVEDGLLLARAAISATNTLAANRALLDALDDGYRVDALDDGYRDGTGEFTPYVPHDLLDLEGATNLRSLAFSQDGALLALGDKAGRIWLWDNAAGTLISDDAVANGSKGEPSLVFDPVRSRLASASGDQDNPTKRAHDLVLWDLEDPNVPQATVLASNQPSIWSLAFSPDGNLLAAGQEDGTVALWDLSGSAPISHTLPGRHADWVYAVAFDPQGQRLASAGKDGLILLWDDIGSAAPVSQTLEGHEAWVNDVVFSPDGTTLASGSGDGTVRLWDVTADPPTSRVLDDRSYDNSQAWELAFSPDGQQLAVGWKDSVLRVYGSDDAWGQPPLELHGHNAGVWDLAFDPMTSGRLVSSDEYGEALFRWDLAQTSEFVVTQPLFQPDDLTLQAVSPDDRWLAAADANGQIFLSEIGSNRWPVSFTVGMSVTALAVAPSDDLLAVAGCTPREDAPGSQAVPTAVPTSQAKPGTTPTVKALQPSTGTVSSAISRARLTDCNMQVWSVSESERLTHTQIISYSQPVRALAFAPNETDKIAVGLETDKIEIRSLVSGSVVPLEGDEVRDLTDLAFNVSGTYLAALGSQGLVRVWNLEDGTVEHESEPGDNEEYDKETRFDEIAFVGDEWLSISISAPDEIGMWTLKTAEQVATFNLGSTAILDLAYDSHQQMLVALEPDRILRWTMSPQQWLELACARAGRNLSFDEWQRAFPDQQDEYKSARICKYPLDISFAEAKIKEAETLINDCTAEQWDEGMKLLEEAAGLPVEPQLDLDRITRAVAILGDQALEHYARNLPAYDEDARKCLEMAAKQLIEAGREGFSLETAEEVGRRQAKLTADLDDPNSLDMSTMMSDLDWLRQNKAQWPGELPSIGLEPGDEINGIVKRNQDTLYFLGEQGQAVTIRMDATGGDLDPLLYLNGSDGYSLTSDDESGGGHNSLISDFVLPDNGLYRILPQAYSGEGAYRLTLDVRDLPKLEFGQTATSESSADGPWLFDGKAGQIVSLDMAISGDGSDPYIALTRVSDRSTVGEDYGRGRIDPRVLPADDLYRVTANLGNASGTFSVTLNLLEPRSLKLGESEDSTPAADAIWTLEGRAGQIISASLVTSDTAALSALSLLSSRGESLAYAASDGTTGSARIPSYILRDDGSYFVRVEDLDAQKPYQLRVAPIVPAELLVGRTVQSTTGGDTLWTLNAAPGQIVQINLAEEGSGLDTILRLFDGDGQQIGYDDDGGAGYNSLLTLVLPVSPSFLVQADKYGGSGAFSLAVAELAPEPLPTDGSSASILPDRAWTVNGEAGQALTIDIVDTGFDGAGYLQLVTSEGTVLASSGDGASLAAILPQDGEYLLLPQNVADSGEDTLTARLTDAASASNLDDVASQTLTNLARNNAIDQALDLYAWGTTGRNVAFTVDALNALCWHGAVYGALHGSADRVITICEELVDTADTTAPYYLTLRHDIRGVARALTGKIDGAIEDFEYFVDNGGDHASQRQEWIDRLRAGEPVTDVLDEATLRQLLLQ